MMSIVRPPQNGPMPATVIAYVCENCGNGFCPSRIYWAPSLLPDGGWLCRPCHPARAKDYQTWEQATP